LGSAAFPVFVPSQSPSFVVHGTQPGVRPADPSTSLQPAAAKQQVPAKPPPPIQ
jgi:hypothetical protein